MMPQLRAASAEKRKKSVTKGLIADIQRASFHDGDGIRTTVFLKGCPLNCVWCHNPECISFDKQTMFYPEKCIGCGMCDKGCYSGAKVICGTEMTPLDVFNEIKPDIPYYFDDGGVTISGGEPMAQKNFCLDFIRLLKKNSIGVAMETSLIIFDEEVFKDLDFIMCDLKIWDNGLHKKYTCVENLQIKENFKLLNSLDIPIIARTPVIPEISQGISEISAFLKNLNNVKKYELLPYHPLGISKCDALGEESQKFSIPTKEYMKELEKYVFVR